VTLLPDRPVGEVLRPSGTAPYWSPGTAIWWHYRRASWQPGAPETIRPMRVIRDDASGLVAWLAPGTPVVRPVLADGRDLRSVPADEMFAAARASRTDTWGRQGVLKIAPTGQPWSVWLFWDPGWTFECWYVNLEDPHRRSPDAVVSQDHVLDLVVSPDRSVRRKDEDELAAAVRQGRYDQADADRFLADAASVEDLIDRWAPPFDQGWENWRPDPGWPVPTLPS
jgi:hypothetical protein